MKTNLLPMSWTFERIRNGYCISNFVINCTGKNRRIPGGMLFILWSPSDPSAIEMGKEILRFQDVHYVSTPANKIIINQPIELIKRIEPTVAHICNIFSSMDFLLSIDLLVMNSTTPKYIMVIAEKIPAINSTSIPLPNNWLMLK
ncbi:MAG: hypothetical protein JRG73_09615 [Deltaproteobacteria bacterium]|nr:hypothetical protein [Deltaproteobacteria bacterium]